MSGSAEAAVYDLVDLESGLVVGQIRGDGVVVAGDEGVRERVAHAFAREVMVRDGELIDDLGVCFVEVQTLYPGDPDQARIVMQNLGRIAGYLPRQRARRG